MYLTVTDLLAQLAASATSEKDKGDKFERLVRKFLQLDTAWASRFSEVFMWTEWPGRDGQPDRGIDLVAIDRETRAPWAVQCKFYAPDHYLTKPDIDSFLAESGKHPFVGRLIVSTTERWNPAAEASIQNQQIPVQRIGMTDLLDSSIDWSHFSFTKPEDLPLKPKKKLRPHQDQALAAVHEGLATHDRGKLIMACGTGKTFTSLRIAESEVGSGGSVLFLVPSIALLSQSLKEWSLEAETPLRTFAVCSDSKVGKDKGGEGEDISIVDLEIPATTDPTRLITQVQGNPDAGKDRMTVVFSTYQSIDVIHQAQDHGLGRFDLIICDEAHRTTGATLSGTSESAFVKIHDDNYIGGAKRLYMTATPRIYDDASKAKAGQADALLSSMDDEDLYGPEFHRLDFGEAVALGLLSDYRVVILTVPEDSVSRMMQSAFAVNSELNLPDAAKIIGCWNGLAKRGGEQDFPTDPEPMRRAVAFGADIKTSKLFTEEFGTVAGHYADLLEENSTTIESDGSVIVEDQDLLDTEVHHVDGTMNILTRNAALDWLRSEPPDGHCRILSNARCLAEGVDVPALDAVIFLNPRKSEVDVVQAVGRVMRQAPGKKYGYIILPIGIPAGETPHEALRRNDRFSVIWKVLQALRAHDSRFNAMINQIELNSQPPAQLRVIGVDLPEPGERKTDPATPDLQAMLPMDWQEWRDAIYAKIVDKVGSRRYWEDWAKDVADIVEAHTARLTALVESGDWKIQAAFTSFLGALRANLNDSIDTEQAISMLSQHMITKPVFDALFEDYSFSAHNPVAQVMQGMLDALEGSNLEAETAALDKFYTSVRERIQGIDNAQGKQRVLMELYEKFFRLAFKKTAESLGIVYTPVEIVDFIIRAVNDLLQEHFGQTLSDKGVHILDPFTGTGTFIVRLLESGLIKPKDLVRKYEEELHANEILLLAYYIAAANIEVTFRELQRDDVCRNAGCTCPDYEPFPGIVLTDTFQMTETGDTLDNQVFVANNDRASTQLELPIRVILGNPPYSVGQTSGNDDNANLKYSTLDARIESTYAAQSKAVTGRTTYDSYIRAMRWASDRLGQTGIVSLITNNGYLNANSADGLRLTLCDEYDDIYVLNLRGNSRDPGQAAKREGGNVFGVRVGVAIIFLVKRQGAPSMERIRYYETEDHMVKGHKLRMLSETHLGDIPWQDIYPNPDGDWTLQRSALFETYLPLIHKQSLKAVFVQHSLGLGSNRDAWVYNSSLSSLKMNVERMVERYNEEVARLSDASPSDRKVLADRDPRAISWSSSLDSWLAQGRAIDIAQGHWMDAQYRPFCRQMVYCGPGLIHRLGGIPSFFPTPAHDNMGFTLTGASSHYEFAILATTCLPDLHLLDTGQFFARWRYESIPTDSKQEAFHFEEQDTKGGYRKVDNITDSTLRSYQERYGMQVTKDDIFFHVYGLLHSTDYRESFAVDLKKMLPRIPMVADLKTFEVFVTAGRELFDLHTGYEKVDPCPNLIVTGDDPQGDPYDWYRVDKMRYGGKSTTKDKTTVICNPRITVTGIPLQAQEYMLGARSALDWILERYQVKIDKPSGIVNDPNDWSREHHQPRYILDLLTRIVTVSIRTVEIVDSLPNLEFNEDGAVARCLSDTPKEEN
ncbi:MAG: DEAD/DEAH box helicase family protein [Propionibacteriaceae bacterium]|nr:DEAD/DEAH box helicase family protein [Propionibacteriaceae bacterium]